MNNTNRFLYKNEIDEFIKETTETILGKLSAGYHGNIIDTQVYARKEEILLLQDVFKEINKDGQIIFEYDIPRLGKRIDVTLLIEGIIFCLEFKVGEANILESDLDQVLDYALDLKYFHKFSDDKLIVPILVPTKYKDRTKDILKSVYNDKVINPVISGSDFLPSLISDFLRLYPNESPIDPNWVISPYAPTPTIIEAARYLYENHSVENISRHEADNVSTDRTISYILSVIRKSKENKEKSICFVTGVPGAGKTLIGLDVAIKQTYQGNNEPNKDDGAVYLSGNGPLVVVLTEALAIDNQQKCKKNNIKKNMSDSRR